ncbi:alpha-D-ribose 1-methylphosphonate 5-triphosphate diphosphatase [Paenibacillus sp. J5C_2022]|uniref:alpha-D-ribose 1-methylphosphonate 5-triphosphate diphosphatase n=1 Tax=Paenibacillus sp. J5C2022 TaxID=2977129 RepID=UPI0021D0DA1B|nr:alpha-D-ribose 1-methylphosphonate 5-triphosphate diphosphatase [Paenibacillus sp. J5C2022]MCU6711984.1 alpha-D-ribose 1-methylphosphonate 5-triphosphate diphosphatase [Paenibacillus sp. J5C2022]
MDAARNVQPYDDTTAPILIVNGTVVLQDEVVRAAVAVEGTVISALLSGNEEIGAWKKERPNAITVDASGKYVLPGLIDIHCDAIEKEVQPRPGTLFPLPMALMEFERKLPLHGITTMFHSLSLGTGLSLRGVHLLTDMVDQIRRHRRGSTYVRNRIHLRFEISFHDGRDILEKLLNEGDIHYLSIMDHSPGQGQYRKPGSFERYVMKNQGVTAAEVAVIVDELMERRERVDYAWLKSITEQAVSQGIAVASHDDDSPELIERQRELGVTVSEFPINMETARYAAESGMYVCVGAPNVVRGASHDDNLRAVDAIKAGAAHILCSDYHPSSLLAAIFRLADEGSAELPAAVAMASLRPAEAMGLSKKLGSIAAGKAADLILVDFYEGMPLVTNTIVDGTLVYSACTRH